MPNLYRKHPVSIAVSMALLAAAATSAKAAEPDAAAADTPAQNPAQPDASEVDTVTVYGVRQSQIRAIEVKRKAASIQDSISAESIGQRPARVPDVGVGGGRDGAVRATVLLLALALSSNGPRTGVGRRSALRPH